MRLWHKNLIPILPREQLVAQWREISAIAGSIQTKGTPNHILVNKIMDYPMNHFITYAAAVRSEMTACKYRTMDKVWDKIVALKPNFNIVPYDELYKDWMNDTYFIICYYNLKEKWMCGGISNNDWQRIENLYEVVMMS